MILCDLMLIVLNHAMHIELNMEIGTIFMF